MLSPLVGIGLLAAILLASALSLNDTELHLHRIETALIELHGLEALFDSQVASVGIHLASGSDESLAAYRDVAAAESAFTKVRDLISDNPGQRARIDSARDKYLSWRKFADNEINQVLTGRSQLGATRRSGESVEAAVHSAFTVLDDVERQLRTDSTAQAASARSRLVMLISLGGLALAVGLSVLGTKQLSLTASDDASKYQRLADEHSNTVREWGLVRTELGDLRRLVRERTANLNAVSSQLEALAYAVSRHLRRRLEQAEILVRDVWYESLDDAVDREALHQLAHEVSSAQRLQEALLTYARLTRIDLSVDRIGLNEILDAVQEDLHPEISRAQAQVTVAPRLPEVQGNRAVLMQIFSHLLANAVRSGADEPKIKVWALPAEGTVRVWVEDNGIGIAPNDQERIFKLFERVRSDTNDQGGIGIGLAIVRLAVERLGGRAGVESALGQGSRFWIELPPA
jgi:signal transduction histidine kinase